MNRWHFLGIETGERIELVKMILDHGGSFDILPSLVWGGREGRSIKVIEPSEYLAMALLKHPLGNGETFLIDGNVALTQREGKILLNGCRVEGANCDVKLEFLPPGIVTGNLGVTAVGSLRRVECSVIGELKMSFCGGLETVSGETIGRAIFQTCGIQALGGNFRCCGSVFAINCRKLRTINCEAEGDFFAVNCPSAKRGNGFMVGGRTNLR